MELEGEFGDKHFSGQLEELLADKPFVIVNLKLKFPTVKGAWLKAPPFMSF